MAWGKDRIQLDNGMYAEAQAPEIISVSRSTDIPAFFADWFFTRLKKGADVARDMERQPVQGKPQSFELGAAPFNPFDDFRNVRPEEFMQ